MWRPAFPGSFREVREVETTVSPNGWKSAHISSVMQIVAFGSEASSLITSSAMVFNFDLAMAALTSALPWNVFVFGTAVEPEPVCLLLGLGNSAAGT